MNTKTGRRRVGATRAAFAGILVAGSLATVASAAAYADEPTDRVDQTIDEVVDTTTETVDSVTGGNVPVPVDDVVDTVTDTVDGVTGGGDLPIDGIVDEVTTTLDDVAGGALGDSVPANEASGTDPLTEVLDQILGGTSGGGGNPLGELLDGLSGGGGADGLDDANGAVKDLLTQVVDAITKLEDQICASPLGDVLRQVHEALDPVLTPVKGAVYDLLYSAFDTLGDALMNEDIKLTPAAIQVIVDKLACPVADDYGPGDDNGPVAPNTTTPTPPASEPQPTGGDSLPFTGAGALALAGLGSGLVAGGHLFRRFAARRNA